MDSIWEKTAEPPRFNQLEGDLRTDVLIVGGGLAGLLCAHKLARAGVDCALVEADRLCGGVTGRADDAVRAFLEGTLQYQAEATCSHHEHHEHHGCHGRCGEEKHDCSGSGGSCGG